MGPTTNYSKPVSYSFGLQVTRDVWPYVVATVSTTILLVWVLVRCWQRMCKATDITPKTHIYLQFSTGNHYTFVKILTMRGLPGDFEFSAQAEIEELKVTGVLCPTLTHQWPSLTIRDRVSNNYIAFPSQSSISWKTALQLRWKLARAHSCVPVLYDGDRIIRVRVNEVTQSEYI